MPHRIYIGGARAGVCYTTVCTTESFSRHSLEDTLCNSRACFVRKHTHTCKCTHLRAHAHARACTWTHTQTCAYTHTHTCPNHWYFVIDSFYIDKTQPFEKTNMRNISVKSKTNFTRPEGRSQEVGQWRFQRLLVQIWIQKHNYFLCECIDNTQQWWWWHRTGLESTIAMIITRWIMLRCTQGCNDIKCNNNATSNNAVLVWGNSYNVKSLRRLWIYANTCFAIFYIFKQNLNVMQNVMCWRNM